MSAEQPSPQPTVEVTEPPHPNWVPGDTQSAPFDVSKKVSAWKLFGMASIAYTDRTRSHLVAGGD